jgi:hypothetical protein
MSGSLRLHWRASNLEPNADGTFRLTLHSAVSGRPLSVAVDARGNASGTVYAPEDPRPMYVVVESTASEWSFEVEEGFTGAYLDRAAGFVNDTDPARQRPAGTKSEENRVKSF